MDCSAHDKDRARIVHPALVEAFDADWYYPWWPEDWPEEDRNHPKLQAAVKDGWAEWIETPSDIEAVKQGFVYDLSRDNKGRVVYWHKGGWVRIRKLRGSRKIVKIPIEQEQETIKYVGRGDHFCRFAEAFLFHTKQPLEGQPYRFMHWQRKLALTVFGWITHTTSNDGKPTRYRRFLQVLVELAKKNAKSDLGSIVTIYLIRADHTVKAFVYGAASDKKQAGIVFQEARDYVQASPELSEDIRIKDSRVERQLKHFGSGSTYEVVSADAHRNDGYDAHGVVFDELHQQPNRRLYVIFRRSGQARPQPLEFVTTTYGQTLKSIWGEVHLRGKDLLCERRVKIDKFVMIASAEPIQVTVLDDSAKGQDHLAVRRLEQPIAAGEVIEFESSAGGSLTKVVVTQAAKRFQRFLLVKPLPSSLPRYSEGTANENPLAVDRLDHAIRRANPSVDIVTPLERIKSLILEADGPEAAAEAKRFNLNIVAGGGNLWLSGAAWMACGRKRILPSSLVGRRCIGGLDISQVNDLTAFWLAFPSWNAERKFARVRKPKIRLVGLVWVPGDDIETRETIEEIPYRSYASARYFADFGFVRICDGPTIDYRQVGDDIVKLCSYFKVQVIAYDSHRSNFIVDPYLTPEGLNCVVHRQGKVSMAPATQQFESLVKRHALEHGNHPMLDAAVEGCVLTSPDQAGNRHPGKDKSFSRIDPLISAVMATNWVCNPPEDASGGAWNGETGSGLFDE